MCLRYLTAGESHGTALVGILDGMPSGVSVKPECFARLLQKRQAGYGRGPRSKTQPDTVEIISGIVDGLTIGSPVSLLIKNHNPADLSAQSAQNPVPLPGHADFAGALKYGFTSCHLIRERASARETAMRVALSVPPRNLLSMLNIKSTCFVDSLGDLPANIDYTANPEEIAAKVMANGDAFLTPDTNIIAAWSDLVDRSARQQKSLGGAGSIIFWNLPIGLGSHTQFDRRLDSVLSSLIMSIPGIKGIEISGCDSPVPTQWADALFYDQSAGFYRQTNNCGGIEGGISNGSPLIIRFFMKPLPANADLASVNLGNHQMEKPPFYRSDVHALHAAAIVAESVVAVQLACEVLKVTGGDHFGQIKERYDQMLERQSR